MYRLALCSLRLYYNVYRNVCAGPCTYILSLSLLLHRLEILATGLAEINKNVGNQEISGKPEDALDPIINVVPLFFFLELKLQNLSKKDQHHVSATLHCSFYFDLY